MRISDWSSDVCSSDPADFTFVCPTELEDLAEQYEAFKKIGVEIYSVSTDTHFSHKAWHDTSDAIGKVQYPMIADLTHVLARNFVVLIAEEGIALRGTFVVNPHGDIKEIGRAHVCTPVTNTQLV